MKCKECGEEASGNYCSNCGQKIRTDVEEFHIQKKRMLRKFKKEAKAYDYDNGHTGTYQIAEACWDAAIRKYNLNRLLDEWDVARAFDDLKKAENLAYKLFVKLKELVEEE